MCIPRPEHPKPQFQRSGWMNLNGLWAFEIDNGKSGFDRGLSAADAPFSGEILVPFCPESKLSGVEHRDFLYSVWYRRTFELTAEQVRGRTALHFGAVDYECDVYINGQHAGFHKGGYVSFCFDITAFVQEGCNVVTVWARDDTRDPMIPTGKQCLQYHSYCTLYTRTTGIWQTVWLEFTPKVYIRTAKYDTDAGAGLLTITAQLEGAGHFTATASYQGRKMGEVSFDSAGGHVVRTMELVEKHLWEPGKGRLYDLRLEYNDDCVDSYFGLRSVRLDGPRFLINDKSVFQRLVLDQGFYPDGVYTAPEDRELEADIDRAMTMGFNGARLHEKIFEERFLYHCDKKGYLVWGEFPNWGLNHCLPESIFGILPEWMEAVNRDYNHPSIIGWCPFNETYDWDGRKQNNDVIRIVYRVTKAMDTSRPCIDTSGNYHVETDIFDVHDYDQNPQIFKAHYNKLMTEGTLHMCYPERQQYTGGPVFMSEFGGIQWEDKPLELDEQTSWGYGDAPRSEQEFKDRFRGLVEALIKNDRMFGFCYTQLTDVEQEHNGLYTFDRRPKFDAQWFRDVLSQKASIED